MIFKHPKNVCMTYFEHMKISLTFSFLFFKGNILSIIHAFLPDLFISSTTDINQQIYNILKDNGCH